ncbi:MAG: HD family hydrolase [Ruminococcus sp.]
METDKLLDILNTASRLKDNTRHSWTPKGRRESVAEHSWRLSLFAYFIKDEFPEVDIDRVIRMCILHDMGEAFTGDIPSFKKTDTDEDKELSALFGWVESLPENFRNELMDLYREMLEQKTDESRLYKALDKLEAAVAHNEADLSTWIDLEYGLNPVYGYEECQHNPYLKKLQSRIKEISLEKIKNHQKNDKQS